MKIVLQKETHVLCKPGMIEVSNTEASRLLALGVAKPVPVSKKATVAVTEPAEEEAAAEPVKKRTRKKGK